MIRLRVKEVAERQGYNISSLSRATDINIATIRRIWNYPDRGVNLKTLSKIADTLGVPLAELTEEIPDNK